MSAVMTEEIYRASLAVIPGGVNSPVRAFPGLSQTPLIINSGKGATITDVDGNVYLDYCCSWGALIHGHAHPQIVEPVLKRVAMGSSFGITTPIESELAQLVVKHLPSIEKVRFVSSGTEATMSAARLARGFTKRDLLIKFTGHYHGHADAFLVQAGSGAAHVSTSAGVPEDFVKHTLCLPFNDFEACRRAFHDYGNRLAGVIVEPIAANMGLVRAHEGFLHMLREESSKYGALLIFDEVITGFRVALGGAQQLYGIKPDLTCLGKIVGGGFPAAAFGGREEVMEHLAPLGDVYQAGTLSGNPVAMEAGLQALTLCEQPGFYPMLEEKRRFLTDPIHELIEKKGLDLCLHVEGSLFTLFFGQKTIHRFDHVKNCATEKFVDFFHKMFQSKIYISPSQFEVNFISTAHKFEDLAYTRDCICDYLSEINR